MQGPRPSQTDLLMALATMHDLSRLDPAPLVKPNGEQPKPR